MVKWETAGWTMVSKARVTRDPISAMAMSPDGVTIAAGNCEGHVTVVNTSNLSVASVNRGAHMSFVSTMAFNTDGTAFLSVRPTRCCRPRRRHAF